MNFWANADLNIEENYKQSSVALVVPIDVAIVDGIVVNKIVAVCMVTR